MTETELASALEREGSHADPRRLLMLLRTGSYRPRPPFVRRRRKADGTWRQLGVPRPSDMAVQRLAARLATPRLDHRLSDGVHGFRPRRSVETALRSLERHHAAAIVVVDIAELFDSLDAEHLRQAHAWLPDRWWSSVISGQRGCWRPPVPQGAPLSPLLANLILSEVVDRHLDAEELRWVRYADDIVLLIDRCAALHRTITWVHGLLRSVRLELRSSKTRVLQREPGRSLIVLGRPVRLVHGRVVLG